MSRAPGLRNSTVAVLALAGLVLTGCASSTHTGSPQMMGGAGSSVTGSAGAGMMGGGSDYHYSALNCAAPTSLPGHRVTVTLADMGMTAMVSGVAPMGAHMMLHATPTTVSAGQVSVVAENMGWRTHELVILPLAAGAVAGARVPGSDGKVDEAGSRGEASASCAAGTGDGITARSVGWTTLTLTAGHYELVCNLQNHYTNGMRAELDVT